MGCEKDICPAIPPPKKVARELCFVRMGSERRVREKKLEAVQLVYFARSGIIIDRSDVRFREPVAQFLDHALSGNMVGQTGKRLYAGDTRNAGMDKFDHLGGEEPTLPGHVPE